MELNADELTEARRVIARALEEDLRYGPDVTTLATVSADAEHDGVDGRPANRA